MHSVMSVALVAHRQLHCRTAEHIGLSECTGLSVSNYLYLVIYEHAEENYNPLDKCNFKILDHTFNIKNLVLLELLHIFRFKWRMNVDLPIW